MLRPCTHVTVPSSSSWDSGACGCWQAHGSPLTAVRRQHAHKNTQRVPVGALEVAAGVVGMLLAGLVGLTLGLTSALVAEAFVPSFGVLGIGGVIAFVIGATVLMDTDGIPGFELSLPLIIGLAIAGVGIAVLVARMAMRSFKHRITAGREAMIGWRAEVEDWAGLSGHVYVHGERWNATAAKPLQPGQKVRITAIDGLTLDVAADHNERPDGVTAL